MSDAPILFEELPVIREPEPWPAFSSRVYARLPQILAAGTGFFSEPHEADLFLTGAIGTISNALPNLRFRYGKTYHSPHLMFFGVGRPGSGKDAMRQGFRIGSKIREHLRADYEQRHGLWLDEKTTYDNRDKRKSEQHEPPGPEPFERLFTVGQDVTLPALAQELDRNREGLLIAATEADMISRAIAREHGGFDPLFRAAFHNEHYQKTLKGEGNIHIDHVRLALCCMGTPDQLKPLLSSIHNGLYSRFAYYRCDVPVKWVSQYENSRDTGFETYLDDASRQVLGIYNTLKSRTLPLYFDVSEQLWVEIDAVFASLMSKLDHGSLQVLDSCCKRGALIAFRIALILCVLRNVEQGRDLGKRQSIEASDDDVEAARLMAGVYVEHGLKLALELTDGLTLPDLTGTGGDDRMTVVQRRFFEALPSEFSTQEAKTAAESVGVTERTVFNWLGKWQGRTVVKLEHGAYRKLSDSPEKANDTICTSFTIGTFDIFDGDAAGDNANNAISDSGGLSLDNANNANDADSATGSIDEPTRDMDSLPFGTGPLFPTFEAGHVVKCPDGHVRTVVGKRPNGKIEAIRDGEKGPRRYPPELLELHTPF